MDEKAKVEEEDKVKEEEKKKVEEEEMQEEKERAGRGVNQEAMLSITILMRDFVAAYQNASQQLHKIITLSN